MSSEPPPGDGVDPPPQEPPAEPPPAAGEGEPLAEPGQEPAPAVCSTCGTPLAPDQTYCLECGSPTPLAPPLRRSQRATVLVAAIIAALAVAVVILATALATDDDGGGPAATSVETFPTVVTDATISTGTPPFATSTTLPPDTSFTTPTAPATTPSQPSGSASDWPAGRSGYTAVVSSVRSLTEATATKGRVQATGQPAGVLQSSDFSTLRPGYYVVFSGVFSTQGQAAAQARQLESSFPGAYPRRIAP